MFVVFDLDGTLADDSHRTHFLQQDPKDWDSYFAACEEDTPIEPMVRLYKIFVGSFQVYPRKVQIWTGRTDRYYFQTMRWLHDVAKLGVSYNSLLMRPEGDHRSANVLKGEWVEKYGKPDLVFDDRTSAVKWWREQGITCLQVADNDY